MRSLNIANGTKYLSHCINLEALNTTMIEVEHKLDIVSYGKNLGVNTMLKCWKDLLERIAHA